MVVNALIPAPGRQSEGNLCESEASLVCGMCWGLLGDVRGGRARIWGRINVFKIPVYMYEIVKE